MAETSENRLASDPTPSRLIPEFPDEISEQFIARVPLSSHQELARVSRSWRILICSRSIFKIRSQIRATERFLCIHLGTPTNQSRWYLLFRDHNGIPSNLVILPPTPIPTFRTPFTSLGHSLYVLGGSSNIVQIFDARLGTWTTVPSMGISRQSAVVAAIRDRVYVVGGCLHSSDSWAEAVDPESGEWFPVPSPPNLRVKRLCASVVYEGALMAMTLGGGGFVFNPVGAQPWRGLEFQWDMEGYAMTVVDGYIYSNMAGLRGYHPERQIWMTVNGLPMELEEYLYEAVMTNLGGLLCVVWVGSETEIHFCGIKVWTTSSGGFQGSIQWSASTVPLFQNAILQGCVTLEF